MLTELRLQGLGVVAEAVVPLGPGLTVLTGETGAGKTMIVAGLGLLLGNKADAGMVRRGLDKAVVEGRWLVSEQVAAAVAELGGDVDDGEELATRRQVSANGRSRAVLGGVTVPVSILAGVLDELATVHGQSGQIRLSQPERQRELLDAHARPASLPRYRQALAERRTLATELDELVEAVDARNREIELLRFGLEEINAAEPLEGEDEQLAREAARLQDADGLRELAAGVRLALGGGEDSYDSPGAATLADEARKLAEQLSERDDTAAQLARRVAEVSYELHDLVTESAAYAADVVTDPIRLEAVAERRAVLAGLTRRYGQNLTDVIAWAKDAAIRLEDLQGADHRVAELTERLSQLDTELFALAERISADRSAAADRFAAAVQSELQALALPQARLAFEISRTELGPEGFDRVEIMFAANPGSVPAPLGKVASGGELSRIRLAIEVVLAVGLDGHTYVFDEVDAGVGGAVGLEIGRRLKRLAEHSQVIVVTHLAQVAAFADHHLTITKSSDGEVTTSDVRPIDEAGRAAELSRMMGGSKDSSAGLRHAVELLQRARESVG